MVPTRDGDATLFAVNKHEKIACPLEHLGAAQVRGIVNPQRVHQATEVPIVPSVPHRQMRLNSFMFTCPLRPSLPIEDNLGRDLPGLKLFSSKYVLRAGMRIPTPNILGQCTVDSRVNQKSALAPCIIGCSYMGDDATTNCCHTTPADCATLGQNMRLFIYVLAFLERR